ncbi:hypothetical protein M0804_005522 [Polistes exclamans]|nr:hypothetical protein M0804_005522 [Polistes exclamans]
MSQQIDSQVLSLAIPTELKRDMVPFLLYSRGRMTQQLHMIGSRKFLGKADWITTYLVVRETVCVATSYWTIKQRKMESILYPFNSSYSPF